MAEARKFYSRPGVTLRRTGGAVALACAMAALGISDVAAAPDVTRVLQDADSAERTGNLNLALIQLKNAALLAPKDGDIRARLGAMLLETGQAVAAERELRTALDYYADPEKAIPPLLSAMLQRKEINQLLKEFPDPPQGLQDKTAPDVLIGRAMAFQALAKPVEARAAMDRSLALRRDAAGLVNAARLAQQQDNSARARSLAQEALRLAPDNEQALLIAALLARRSGDLADALSNSEKLIRRAPQSVIARALRIDVLLELKRDADARGEFEILKKQSPRSPYVGYYSGVLKARSRDYKGAWGEMQGLAPEFVQSDAGIAMMVARVAVASGDAETGGTILGAWIARHADNRDARMLLAAVRLSQNSAARALEVLAPLKSSTDPAVQGLLAQAYLQQHKYEDAIRSLEIRGLRATEW